MIDFFQSVLPSSGSYCIVGINQGRLRHSFYNSLEAAEDRATALDAAGVDAYFALATFDQESRKAEHSVALRCFFADIDCGPNKPYPDQAAAAVALRAFLTASGLPEPTVVNSGGGLHVYWPLTEDLPTATWKPAAEAFKRLCVQHKLAIDLSCSADAARILRVPGTNNYKQATPRPVQIISAGKPTAFSDFRKLLPAVADLAVASSFGVDETTKAIATGELPPSSFAKIVRRSIKGSGCAQIAQAVTEAATLEEPLWRAALSIAWNCEDGSRAVHKLSQPHPEYSPEDTVAKAERLTGKPYTCEWYRLNNPSKCEGCTHKVTSPIVLGTFIPEAKTDDDGAVPVQAPVEALHDGQVQFVDVKIPPLPKGFFRGENGGIYIRKLGDDGEEEHIEVYAHDLYVTERYYDSDESGDGDGELVSINLHLPQDGLRRFSAPLTSLFATDKLRDTLVKHGVVIYGKQVGLVMAYLAASVSKLQSSVRSSRTRNQMGWTTENTFVVGELEYTPAGVTLAPPASGIRQLAPKFHQKGTLEEWKSVIDFYNRPGMELHAFAFFVGAGSPLLQLLNNQQVRGAVVNLVSNGSGTGKTTAQMAINSLYGHPSELLMTQNDTFNAKLHNLGMLNSLCMTVDEITSETPERLSALVYGATSGRAAHRMEAQSNKLRNNKTTWCTIMVTSSNAVLSEAILVHKAAADGELKRIIDLHMPTPSDVTKQESDLVFRKLGHNYGVAGPIFIQHVVANRDEVCRQLESLQVKLDQAMGLERSDRFYSATFTVAMMAARIMERLGLHSIDIKRVFTAAMAAVAANKESSSKAVGQPQALALETLSQFITQNVGNTLVINSEASNTATVDMPRGPLRIRYEPDTQEMVIVASDLRSFFVDRRVDFRSSIQQFINMGALKVSKEGSPTMTRRPAAGAHGSLKGAPTRCYVFNAEVLGVQKLLDDESEAE